MYFLIPSHIKEVLTTVYLHWSVTLRTTHMSLCVSSYIDNRRPTCRFVCPHTSTFVETTKKQNNNIVTRKMLKQQHGLYDHLLQYYYFGPAGMISKMSAFTNSCTSYTQNKFAWNIMIDCFAYQKQKNIDSDNFSRTLGDSMLIQMTDLRF